MWYLLPALQHLVREKRLCRKCGKKQPVRTEDRHKAVACRFCGADLLPPKKGA